MTEVGALGLFVVGAALVAGAVWLIVLLRLPRPLSSVLHNFVIHLTILALLLIDGTILLAAVGQPAPSLRLVIGLAMGVQLVAALAAVLFLWEVRRED